MCIYFSGIFALIHEYTYMLDNMLENQTDVLIHDYINKHLSSIFTSLVVLEYM